MGHDWATHTHSLQSLDSWRRVCWQSNNQTPAALCCGRPVGSSFGVTLAPPLIALLLGRKVPPPRAVTSQWGADRAAEAVSSGSQLMPQRPGTQQPWGPGPACPLSAPFPLEAGVRGHAGSRPAWVCVALRLPRRVNEPRFHVRPESRPHLLCFYSTIQTFTFTHQCF